MLRDEWHSRRLSAILLLTVHLSASCADTYDTDNRHGKSNSIRVMETVRGNSDMSKDLGVRELDRGRGMPVNGDASVSEPEPSCVVRDSTLGCITRQAHSQEELLDALNLVYDALGSTKLIGNRMTCSAELTAQSDVLSSQNYLNLLRLLNHLEPITLKGELKYSECAFIEDVELTGGMWTRSRCHDPNFAQALAVDTEKMSGRWSIYDNLYRNVSSSRTNGIELRHKLLDPTLTELSVGQHYGQSCLGLNKLDRSVSNPFTIFPGLGHVPFEFVNPGNNEAARVPWSIKLHDDLAVVLDVTVLLIQNDYHRTVEIDLFYPAQSDRGLAAWHLSQPPFAGATYKVIVLWLTSTQEARETELLISLDDYGSVMPERCDPEQLNQCIIPGYDCLNGPLNETIGWYCVSGGPMESEENCSDYEYACQSGYTCLHSAQGAACYEYCIRETEGPRSCNRICERSGAAGTQTDVNLGYCF